MLLIQEGDNMAIPVPIRKIYMADVIDNEGNVQAERLLYPLNLFLETTYNLLDGNLEFGENVKSQISELEFKTSSTYESAGTFTPIVFKNNINSKVNGLIMLNIYKSDNINEIIIDPVTLQWQAVKREIKITFVTGLKSNTRYKIKIMVV